MRKRGGGRAGWMGEWDEGERREQGWMDGGERRGQGWMDRGVG